MLASHDGEAVSDYCPNCRCHNCEGLRRQAQFKQDRLDALEAKKRERDLEIARLRRENAELFRRECAMVWLIVNTATDQLDANQKIQTVAEALSLSRGQVNTRRTVYATALTKRVHSFNGFLWGDRWAALPGTEGTELPDYCEKCGGMKTMGAKCKRCDYRRGSRYVPDRSQGG
jgi:hypothetical protein